ncbi:MAG: flagellar hook assembly protein FlgD [Nitrospirae bacterium]|nr:flagellar hook assembly protein FlgD [Nitrospirota bacterium]
MDLSSINSATTVTRSATSASSASNAANSSTLGSSGSTSGSTSGGSSTGNLTDTSEFLKLFTTQLQYQDPLNPMDSSTFTSQLAQFSSLEQLTNINTNLKSMSAYENSLNNLSAVGMIGKTVTTTDNKTSQVTGINFNNGVTSLTLKDGENIGMSSITNISQTS